MGKVTPNSQWPYRVIEVKGKPLKFTSLDGEEGYLEVGKHYLEDDSGWLAWDGRHWVRQPEKLAV